MSRRTLSTNRYAKVTITDIAWSPSSPPTRSAATASSSTPPLAANGVIAFGENSWSGDLYEAQILAVLADTGHITGDYAARFARTAR